MDSSFLAPWLHRLDEEHTKPDLQQIIHDLKAIQAQSEFTAPTLYWQIGAVVSDLRKLQGSL